MPALAAPEAVTYAISGGSLDSALSAFGVSSGVQVLYDSSVTAGLRSPGVRGTMAPDRALGQLLAGTGLRFQFVNDASVTVFAAGTGGPQTDGAGGSLLPRINVHDESPWGTVDGYVATRNASATKTDTPLIETPQSVSVVTADQVTDQGAVSVAESLAYTPGVAAQSATFSRMVDDVQIRGFNVANGNLGSLRDGMKYQSNVYDGGQEPYGLERIEVLRGASSMLYGQLGPGGVINAISKRPTKTPLHEVNVELGTYDRKQVSADFGGPLTEDGVWSYRLTGLGRISENWIESVPDNKVYIAPALTWQPDDTTSLTLLANYQYIDTLFATPLQYADVSEGNIPRDMFLGIDEFDTYVGHSFSTGGEFEHDFDSGVTFKTSARYFRSDVDWDYMYGGLATLSATGGQLARLASVRTDLSYGVTSDTNVQYAIDVMGVENELLGGFDYYRRGYDTHRFRGGSYSFLNLNTGASSGGPNVNYSLDRGSDNRSDQFGIYLQDQITFDDRWVVLLGGRHDWAFSKTKNYQTHVVTDQADSAFTGRAGLVYLFDNGIAPYISVSQSFMPQLGTDASTGDALSANEGLQYEAGIRYQPPSTNIILSAAIYDLTQKNVTTTNSSGETFQYGKVKSQGVELEARAEFGNLGLIAAYSYTDSRILESAKPAEINQQTPLTPYNMFSVWADYKLDDLGMPGLKVGAGVRHVGETNLTDNDGDVPAYTLVDAMASYDLGTLMDELEGASLTLNARNLFDTEFYTCSYSDGCRYGEPRTLSARLSYKW